MAINTKPTLIGLFKEVYHPSWLKYAKLNKKTGVFKLFLCGYKVREFRSLLSLSAPSPLLSKKIKGNKRNKK